MVSGVRLSLLVGRIAVPTCSRMIRLGSRFSLLVVIIWFRRAFSKSLVSPLELGHLTTQALKQFVVRLRTVLVAVAHLGVAGRS